MKKMSRLKDRISGVLTGILLLTMPVLPAVAADAAEQTAAAGNSAAMYPQATPWDQEVGVWVERPASLQSWFLGMTGQISDKERLERKMSWYEWNRGSDALAEIVVLAE